MVNTITHGLPASYYAAQYRTPDGGGSPPSGDAPGRRVRDTVEISKDGQKIINLARGAELAAELPDAARDRAAFDAALERAQKDIKRIASLFDGALNSRTVSRPRPPEDGGSPTATTVSDGDVAASLRQALDDIRLASAEVDQTLRQRRSEL